MIQSFHEHVYRIHTDGFYVDSSIDINIPLSTALGGIKLEEQGHYTITSVNVITKHTCSQTAEEHDHPILS